MAKRKIETVSSVRGKSNTDVFKKNMLKKDESAVDETLSKRRRKFTKGSEVEESVAKQADSVLLPQKKRAFVASGSSSSPCRSPAKKTSKGSATNADEHVDDETLIRETEAALKSLSGSWAGPRGSFYNRGITEQEDRFESPAFENLFEEKKVNTKLAASSAASTSSGCSDVSSCSLKDVITLRDQQDAKNPKPEHSKTAHVTKQQQQDSAKPNCDTAQSSKITTKTSKEDKEPSQLSKNSAQEGNVLEHLLKIENECESIQSQSSKVKGSSDKSNLNLNSSDSGKCGERYNSGPRYEPDFNELVDDSSNELEIDMSDPAGEKDDDEDKHDKSELKLKKGSDNNKKDDLKTVNIKNENRFDDSFTKTSKSKTSAFSSTSAFRPISNDSGKDSRIPSNSLDIQNSVGPAMSPLGPFPAGATFVGYPPTPVLNSTETSLPNRHPMSPIDDKRLIPLKPTKIEVEVERQETVNVSSTKNPALSVGSPEAATSKQYTILQPASMGSRAASAIQDVARERVLSVAAVSSSSGAVSSTQNISSPTVDSPSSSKMVAERAEANRSAGPLSPSSLNKGKFFFFFRVYIL